MRSWFFRQSPITCNPSDSMIDPGTGIAVVKVKGSCYGGSFGVADNTLTIDYRIRSANGDFGSISSISPAIEANTYAVSISLEDLDYKTEYKPEITVRDALNTVQKTATIIRSIPIADWGEADFRFNVPVKMGDDVFPSEENDVITKKYAEKTFLSAIQSTDLFGCHYRIVDGATEWLIPPMELGVEYRTTERWNSKPVYTRIPSRRVWNNTGGIPPPERGSSACKGGRIDGKACCRNGDPWDLKTETIHASFSSTFSAYAFSFLL